MDEMRMAKFETLIEDIDSLIRKVDVNIISDVSSENIQTPLFLIFTPDELNEYELTICKKASFVLSENKSVTETRQISAIARYTALSRSRRDPWLYEYRGKSFEDAKTRIEAAKDFVKYCRKDEHRPEAYKFIFWSLMILTVENESSDERLSLICDFAHMLRITDNELMDIIYVIKCVYSEVKEEYSFKTEVVPSIFGKLFNMYGNSDFIVK